MTELISADLHIPCQSFLLVGLCLFFFFFFVLDKVRDNVRLGLPGEVGQSVCVRMCVPFYLSLTSKVHGEVILDTWICVCLFTRLSVLGRLLYRRSSVYSSTATSLPTEQQQQQQQTVSPRCKWFSVVSL